MSLTQRLKHSAGKQYQASDGTTYLLQRVNDARALLANGTLPRILATLGSEDAKRIDEKMSNEEFFQLLGSNEAIAETFTAGVSAVERHLMEGLVGELLADGKPLYYRWVDKPLHALEEGEVNVSFIPDELARELAREIQLIGRPAVEERDVTAFPGGQSKPSGSAPSH